jgi:hypothetical protein
MRMETEVPKESLNLSIDSVSIERARRYSQRHDTSISQLVNDFFATLPSDAEEEEWQRDLSPTIRRLLAVGRGEADEEDYREYLMEKYGQ